MLSSPKPRLDKSAVEKILSVVSYDRGFHFFSAVGKYTGETAVSLFGFREELRTAPVESLRFHFERKDFQKWIGDTLGDKVLAQKIDQINPNISDANLRKALVEAVQARFEELHALLKAE